MKPQTPGAEQSRDTRGWGLPIGVWLVLGFALVIAAFVIGSLLAQRGSRLATEELRRVQVDIAPLTRTARDLGESSAAFDRAVLEFLGTDSEQNREELAAAGARLSRAINEAPVSAGRSADPDVTSLPKALAEHQVLGFRRCRKRAGTSSA